MRLYACWLTLFKGMWQPHPMHLFFAMQMTLPFEQSTSVYPPFFAKKKQIGLCLLVHLEFSACKVQTACRSPISSCVHAWSHGFNVPSHVRETWQSWWAMNGTLFKNEKPMKIYPHHQMAMAGATTKDRGFGLRSRVGGVHQGPQKSTERKAHDQDYTRR